MKRVVIIILVSFLILAVASIACLICAYRDCKHQVETYITQLKDEDPNVRKRAAEKLIDIGPALLVFEDAIVSALIEALDDEEEEVKEEVVSLLLFILLFGNDVFIDILHHNDPYIRERAVSRLGHFIGSDKEFTQTNGLESEFIKPPVPDEKLIHYLIDVLGDDHKDVRMEVQDAFRVIIQSKQVYIKETSRLLIQALEHDDPIVRAGAADALGLFENEPRPENILPSHNYRFI